MLIRNKTLAAVWKWIVAVAAFFAVALHGRFAMQGTILISNILLHYVVPICTVIDWLVFDEKGFWTVFLTGMIMELCFFLLGLFWVWLDRWLAKRNEEKHA